MAKSAEKTQQETQQENLNQTGPYKKKSQTEKIFSWKKTQVKSKKGCQIRTPSKTSLSGTKKKKQIEENTAESQSIVVQDNSNSYNTSPKLSRLQMI